MDKGYIKIGKKKNKFPKIELLQDLDDDFWLQMIFDNLLDFYENHDKLALVETIEKEQCKKISRIEDAISAFIRKYFKNSKKFIEHLDINGEAISDGEFEGYYDLKISNTYWRNKNYFPLECKNLTSDNKTINKYVYYKFQRNSYDGGVYRFFNGKYSPNQEFGGLIGFVLSGDIKLIQGKIMKKMEEPFDISPEGDLTNEKFNLKNNIGIHNSFLSFHVRNTNVFKLYHFLLELGKN